MLNMDNLHKQVVLKDKKFNIFITTEEIQEATLKVAEMINRDYQGKSPIFLAILNGSIVFASDLIRQITVDCEIEAISAKSYGDAMHTSGKVELKSFGLDIQGRDVIIIEDIVDTGYTLKALREKLQEYLPNSIATASLLSKPSMRKTEVPLEYVGIEIPAAFVVGYGLDYAGKGRQLKAIYVVED